MGKLISPFEPSCLHKYSEIFTVTWESGGGNAGMDCACLPWAVCVRYTGSFSSLVTPVRELVSMLLVSMPISQRRKLKVRVD